jgi:hypothetical protein
MTVALEQHNREIVSCLVRGRMSDMPIDTSKVLLNQELHGDAAHPMLPFLSQGAAMAFVLQERMADQLWPKTTLPILDVVSELVAKAKSRWD